MMGFPQRGEGNLTRPTSLCKNFQPNMFNKTKCQNCFRTREAHDLDGGDGNNKPKKVLLCGYLFIAPGLDPENPMSRSRKWQRRCFILYENGELAYALDDGINTVPQGVINMYQCSTVFNADEQTGQKFSLAIQTTTATTFIRAETREEKDSWLETLAEYPEINKENERLKQRQLKLAAQHAAREEKYGKLNAKTDAPPSSKAETTPKNNLNQSWPKSNSDQQDILKELDQPKAVNSNDTYKRSQSTLETKSRYSDPAGSSGLSRSASLQIRPGTDQQDYSFQGGKRKNEIPSNVSSKSIRADEETRSSHARNQTEYDGLTDIHISTRASRMRSRIRASDTGISELSKSSAALALGIQRSRSDVNVDRSAYTPLHQNNNNVNSDQLGLGSRGDPQRRSWRLRSSQEQHLPATQELPSPKEKTPAETLSTPTETRSPEAPPEDSGVFARDRSSTNESQTSAVSTGSQSSDDLERLDKPKISGFRLNKAMLDGDSPSPSKRTIERRKHAQNRRSRHTVTVDSSMHVIPSSDESETNKETSTLKRSNSDPNLADSDDMLKRKQIAMTFPGLFHLKKGWLVKQGDGEQDWTKHWFVLCDNKLSYYKDSSDEVPNNLDGIIELAKCNKAAETPVSRNYGFQIELDTGLIILAAMTSGIRNNWVGAINKAIKTAQEDSAKKPVDSPTKENKPLLAASKPNSLPVSKSTSDIRPKDERPSPLQPMRRNSNNLDAAAIVRGVTQTDGKVTHTSLESPQLLEQRSSVPTKTSPVETLPPVPSGKSEGRGSSLSKSSSYSDTRTRRGSIPKEATSSGARRNSVTKETVVNAETRQKQSSSSKDGSSSDSSKSAKSKERRSRKGSRSEKRSQEDSAAAVTAALSKRTSNTDSKHATTSRKSRSNSQTEEVVSSTNAEQQHSPRVTASVSESKKGSSTVDTTVMSLLELEVDTLKSQLETKQQDCGRLQQENANLKAQLNSEQRDHKESFQDLENEQTGYMTQIEQMANRSRQSELTNQKLQAELRQSKNASQHLQQQNQQLANQLTTLKTDSEGRDQEFVSLKGRFEDLVRDLTASESEISDIRSNLKAERERSESLETELTDTWMTLRERGSEAVDVDIERLSTMLEEARMRLEKSETDAMEREEKAQKHFNRLQSQYQEENAALKHRLQEAVEESQTLQKRLTERNEEVDKIEAVTLQAGRTDSNARIEELESSIQELKSQLKTEITSKSEFQRKYDDLVAQSATQFLEGQGDMASTSSDDNAVKLESELNLAGREIEKLRKESSAEKEQKALLEKAFQREQALRKQLEDQIAHSTQEAGSSDNEVEQKNSQIVSLRADLKKAKKEREAVNLVRKQLAAAVDSLNNQLSEKDRRIEKINSEVETRGSQNSKLEQQLQESLSETATLRIKVESMEAELKLVSQRTESEASTQREALQTEQRRLKRQIASLEEQHALDMHNRQSELDTANDTIKSLQEKVAALDTKLKATVESLTRAENDAAANQLDMQKEEELLRAKCDRMEKDVKRLRGELHAAQDNFDELDLQFIKKREEMKRYEQQHEEQIGQMGYRIQDLTSKLAATERKVRDLSGVDHRNRGKGAAGGMGSQLTQTRKMENKLKELESKLGDVENTMQNQDQDTSSLLGKIVSVEQQVQAQGQLSSTSSVPSFDAEHPHQPQMSLSLSRGSSAASAPCDSLSTSGPDHSEDSEQAPASPDKGKQTFRARFLETKLSETELKLKEVTRKLVDVTTRELENRKAYQGKSVSESRLKERLKVMEREVEALTKELQQVQSNSRTFACAMRASLTDCGQLLGDVRSGLEWVDLEIDLEGDSWDGLPNQQQRVEVATNPTTTSHNNMLSCLKSLLTDACHKVDQCKQTAMSQQTHIEKQSRDSMHSLLIRGRGAEGHSASSSFASTTASSYESNESGSMKLSRHRNPSVIETLERFANRLSAEVILLGESSFVLHQTDRQKLAKIQMCLEESDSLTAAMTELETALSSEQHDLNQPSLHHTSQTINDLLSPRFLLQAEACYTQAPPTDSAEGSKTEFTRPFIDRHSKSRSPLKRQRRTNPPFSELSHSKSIERSSVWTPKLDNFGNSLSNTIIKAGQVEYLSKVKKGTNSTSSSVGSDVLAHLHNYELNLEEAGILLQQKQKGFSEMFEKHLKKVIAKLAEILAHENVSRVKSDKERNRRAGLCIDDDDVLGSFDDIFPVAVKDVDITGILDSVGPDLVSYAKQIALREARGTSVNLVEDKMLLVEVFHLLQVRVSDFLKKLSVERSTCQIVLKALSSVGDKRYSHIECLLEEEIVRIKQQLLESYENAVSEVRKGKGLPCGDDEDLHAVLGDYVGLLGSLMIRKVVVGGLVRHVIEEIPHLSSCDGATMSDADLFNHDPAAVSCDLNEAEHVVSRTPEQVSAEHVPSRIPEPVSAEYENLAFHLADSAIARAEQAHLEGQLQDNWEAIMQKGRYSPIEHVTADHARILAEVRRRYENLIHEEELKYEQELNSLQEKYREALSKVEELEAKLEDVEARQASKPEITVTPDEDLSDIVDDLVVTSLSEILAELDHTKETLANTQEELAAVEKEHSGEIDAITDSLEKMDKQYQTEIRTLKMAHEKMVLGLRREFQEHLDQLKRLHLLEATKRRQQVDESLQNAEASPDELGQTRNNGDLVLQEKTHREIVDEMRRSHNQEIKALEDEKERELVEERKATSITIEMLKNAHSQELQAERQMLRQITQKRRDVPPPTPPQSSKKEKSLKFSKASKRAAGIAALQKAHKQEMEQQWSDMQQNVTNDVEVVMKRHREVILKMDRDWKIISDKFTQVCAENVSLKKQLESLEKSLASTRQNLESWQTQVRHLIGQKAEDMAALKEQEIQVKNGDDGQWGVDGNDNEKNPLQVLLRFREAELQCTNNEINQLTAALDDAEKERSKATEQNVFLEGQYHSQEEHINQLVMALEELQHQVEIVRTSGEGEAAPDQVQETGRNKAGASLGSGDTKPDMKLRSWIPFLKRERSDSTGKGSRRRTGSDGSQTAAKLKKSATTTD